MIILYTFVTLKRRYSANNHVRVCVCVCVNFSFSGGGSEGDALSARGNLPEEEDTESQQTAKG